MSGVTQATFMNQRSFKPPTPTVIGQAYEGGFWAGDIGVSGVATHHLVVGPLSTAQFTGRWRTSNAFTFGTASVIDGPANTAAMIAAGAAAHPCGDFCNNLVLGDFSDWYMPASNELEVCYFNLKPTTTGNTGSFGANANAVPQRFSNYPSSGPPAQTSAVAFQEGGAQAFDAANYWASTQRDTSRGEALQFINGSPGYYGFFKTSTLRVRAIRRVPV